MSSKLLGCLNYKIPKVIKPQHFVSCEKIRNFAFMLFFMGTVFLTNLKDIFYEKLQQKSHFKIGKTIRSIHTRVCHMG